MDDKEIVKLYFSRDTTAIDETSKKYGNMCLRLSNREKILSLEPIEIDFANAKEVSLGVQ